MRYDNCIRKIIKIDGANCYVLVGDDFAFVTGEFENRVVPAGQQPMSREGAEKINKTITELSDILAGG